MQESKITKNYYKIIIFLLKSSMPYKEFWDMQAFIQFLT